MAADFHRKTAALFEEFKKRELYYLNTENAIPNNTSCVSLPLQNYLLKINQKEKETEKTYRDLMKCLEDLDRQTDQMSLKLDKLNALRNVSLTAPIHSWSPMDDTLNRPFQLNYSNISSNFFNHRNNSVLFPTEPDYSFKSQKMVLKSEECQTDHIFCEQCNYPLTSLNLSRTSFEPVNKFNNTSEKTTDATVTSYLEQPWPINRSEAPTSHLQQLVSTNEQSFTPSQLEELIPDSQKKFTTSQLETSSPNSQQNIVTSQNLDKRQSLTGQNILTSDDGSSVLPKFTETSQAIIEDNFQEVDPNDKNATSTNTEENKACLEDTQSTDENALSFSDNVETAISKSDDESMNHEFDFLDSEKQPTNKENNSKPITEDSKGRKGILAKKLEVVNNENRVPEKTLEFSNVSAGGNLQSHAVKDKREVVKVTLDVSEVPAIEERKSPSLRSDNLSILSESDSSSEKQVPLTATAAYQALLGNASTGKAAKKKQVVTDSESEDEIENVLAVRKPSAAILDAPKEPQENTTANKEITPVVVPCTTRKLSIQVSSSNPQSKLSKTTRKVLGLDTSSGSEVELEVASTVKNIEEDSDEFDFYD